MTKTSSEPGVNPPGRKALNPAAVGEHNRELVRRWGAENPWGKQKDCAAALGLSVMAVSRHVRAIREESR